MRILVTGATGFVGGHLVRHLAARTGVDVAAVVRDCPATRGSWPAGVELVSGLDLDAASGWRSALEGVDVVVHLAGLAHCNPSDREEIEQFYRVNALGTEMLAKAAASAGVRRLVYLSTIGVHGSPPSEQEALSERSGINPETPYAASKLEGEQRLATVLGDCATDFVIVRSPLVYGPGAPGNMQRLRRLAASGLPLPLAGLQSRRSFIGVTNLCDVLTRLGTDPRASRESFIAGDGEDVTVAGFLEAIRRASGMPPRLFRLPPRWLGGGARLAGRESDLRKLTDSIRVDTSRLRVRLGWRPPLDLEKGIRAWIREDAR
ncbi:NAD-dependent epimerase/dehydratase family protein [Arhodomonas sp. SL1]|uniref:NAD-dependent epimerase/dehydratase family protein n=1 Tax=Arhodomonas sp. SL1 TaxID=3425691 RepID=UPI003F8804CA